MKIIIDDRVKKYLEAKDKKSIGIKYGKSCSS